jgi:hypothetical protein
MINQKKNHHFVPQFHLRGFAIDGERNLIWEYDKQNSTVSKVPKSIRKAICCQPFYYEQNDLDGSKTQKLEDGFGKIESAASQVIEVLRAQRTLTGEGKGTLSFHIALLLTRGPSFRDGCRTFHKNAVEVTVQRLFEADRLPPMPAELREYLKGNDITSVLKAEVIPQVSLPFVLKSAEEIGKTLCNKKWDIFFSDESYFVTSDAPVMFGPLGGNHKGIGPANPESLVICPLRKDIVVAARQYHPSDTSGYEIRAANKEMVTKLNQIMCFKAQRYVYAPVKDQELLEYVKAGKGWSQRLTSFTFGGAVMGTWDTRCWESEDG